MNAKRIEKHFDKLTQHERAVLILNCYGRKDEGEARRLIDSAPRVVLDAPDFGRTLTRLVNVVEWHCLKQAENAANLFLVGQFSDLHAEDEMTQGAVEVCAYNFTTRADGWKLFCGELGLDPVGALRIASADAVLLDIAERIARAVNLGADTIREKLRETFPNIEAEPKTAEQIAAEYRGLAQARG